MFNDGLIPLERITPPRGITIKTTPHQRHGIYTPPKVWYRSAPQTREEHRSSYLRKPWTGWRKRSLAPRSHWRPNGCKNVPPIKDTTNWRPNDCERRSCKRHCAMKHIVHPQLAWRVDVPPIKVSIIDVPTKNLVEELTSHRYNFFHNWRPNDRKGWSCEVMCNNHAHSCIRP